MLEGHPDIVQVDRRAGDVECILRNLPASYPRPDGVVIDVKAHLAMARRHLPPPLMAALLGTAAISIGHLGFGNGRVGRRFSLLDSVYGIVLAVALWMTIDLD